MITNTRLSSYDKDEGEEMAEWISSRRIVLCPGACQVLLHPVTRMSNGLSKFTYSGGGLVVNTEKYSGESFRQVVPIGL